MATGEGEREAVYLLNRTSSSIMFNRGHSADYYSENYGPYLASHSVLLLKRMVQQLEELDFLETPV